MEIELLRSEAMEHEKRISSLKGSLLLQTERTEKLEKQLLFLDVKEHNMNGIIDNLPTKANQPTEETVKKLLMNSLGIKTAVPILKCFRLLAPKPNSFITDRQSRNNRIMLGPVLVKLVVKLILSLSCSVSVN